MAKKKDIYKVKLLNDNKRNIIQSIIEEYNIEIAKDIQEALKELLGEAIKSMMEAEMDEHLDYDLHECCEKDNYRNGTKRKRVRNRYGKLELEVPQDRNNSFEPQVVKKRQKIISMYVRGFTIRQISDQIEDIYGFDCSEIFTSNVTDKI